MRRLSSSRSRASTTCPRHLLRLRTAGGTGFGLTEFYEGCDTPPWLEVSGPDDPAVTSGIFAEYAERYRIGDTTSGWRPALILPVWNPFQQGAPSPWPRAASPRPESPASACSAAPRPTRWGSAWGYRACLPAGLGRGTTALTSPGPERRRSSPWWASPTRASTTTAASGCPTRGGLRRQPLRLPAGPGGAGQRPGAAGRGDPPGHDARSGAGHPLGPGGYSAAAQPLETPAYHRPGRHAGRRGLAALAVLVLFAFLFVGRQRETVQILASLGTPQGENCPLAPLRRRAALRRCRPAGRAGRAGCCWTG